MNRFVLMMLALAAPEAAIAQTAPAIDAQGTPVVSAAATPPAGANQVVTVPDGATVRVNPDQGAVFTPGASAGPLPACSKRVTDRCIQRQLTKAQRHRSDGSRKRG